MLRERERRPMGGVDGYTCGTLSYGLSSLERDLRLLSAAAGGWWMVRAGAVSYLAEPSEKTGQRNAHQLRHFVINAALATVLDC